MSHQTKNADLTGHASYTFHWVRKISQPQSWLDVHVVFFLETGQNSCQTEGRTSHGAHTPREVFLPPGIHRTGSSSLTSVAAEDQPTGAGRADLQMLSIVFLRKTLLCKLVSLPLSCKLSLSPPQPLVPFPTATSLYFHFPFLRHLSASRKIDNYFQLLAECCPLGALQMQ